MTIEQARFKARTAVNEPGALSPKQEDHIAAELLEAYADGMSEADVTGDWGTPAEIKRIRA